MTRLCSAFRGPWLAVALLISFLSLPLSLNAQTIAPKNFSVLASATAIDVSAGGPRLEISWPADTAATGYTISRRTRSTGWSQIAVLGGTATFYTDSNIIVGTIYEYKFVKTTSANYTGYGYLSAAVRAPMQDDFGKIILVVENSLSQPLTAELLRLENDLRAEGWSVIRRNVSAADSPPAVKQVIKSIYDADPASVQAVFLLGHVPVPYSGDIAPDDHANHRGAWPADVYYADMNGLWTDSTVNSVNAEREANHNIPGDGKFDQSVPPSDPELWIGRVDLSQMTCYANKPAARSELDLMRQYLNKNHAFRVGNRVIQRRGLICDNFSDKGDDPIGGSAWRAFPAFFGAENIVEVGWDGYLPAATSGSYLWSFASGGGSYYYSTGVATSDDFALQDIRVVFAMFMGSYFGDWNNESNFLRASLGSGDVLAASYSGFPHALYFPMGLGEPIGYANSLALANGPGGLYPPWTQGTREVHISLHGDPSLRMHPVLPPSNVSATLASGVTLSWTASPDTDLQGYHVFRSTSATGPFARITSSPVQGTSFNDPAGTSGHFYSVSALKLERSGSGTYLNPSQRIPATWGSTPPPVTPAAPSNLSGVALSPSQIRIAWHDNSNNESGFRVFRKAGPTGTYTSFNVGANVTTFTDSNLSGGTQYFYKVHAFNSAGASADTSEIAVTTPLAPPTAPSNLTGTAISSMEIRLQWSDNSNNESGFRVYYKVGASGTYSSVNLGPNSTSYNLTGLAPGTAYFLKVHAFNSGGASSFSNEISVTTPNPPTGPNSAAFVKSDATTSGSWKPAYGYDGALAPFSDFIAPTYVQINANGNFTHTWENPSTRPSALERRTSTSRFATAWQNSASFRFYLQFKDTAVHRVSFYFLDFDGLGRQQKLEFLDYTSGQLLASATISAFQNGAYSTWDLKGKVTVRVTALGSGSAVLSGIFFDPQERLVSTASFVANDSATGGSWKGSYGSAGAVAPYSDFTFPTNVQVNGSGNFAATWENPSTRPAALERRTSTARFATSWQNSGSFYLYLQFKDTAAHRVSFYFHDFEAFGRRQSIEFFDYVTRERLGGTTLTGFQNGLYSTWDLVGKVTVKVTPLGPGSAVLSGVFFDAPAQSANAVRFLGANSSTSGNWKGTFGSHGFQLAGDATQLPVYAAVTLSGSLAHVWNSSPTDPAALERAASSGRIAACWYAGETVELTVNVTDGSTRKISFYSLDWDMQNRTQRIDVLDASTGSVLHTTTLGAFQDGVYHSYDVKGSVRFRFTRTGPLNAVVSGFFFDAPSAPL